MALPRGEEAGGSDDLNKDGTKKTAGGHTKFKPKDPFRVKLVDLGNACWTHKVRALSGFKSQLRGQRLCSSTV